MLTISFLLFEYEQAARPGGLIRIFQGFSTESDFISELLNPTKVFLSFVSCFHK